LEIPSTAKPDPEGPVLTGPPKNVENSGWESL